MKNQKLGSENAFPVDNDTIVMVMAGKGKDPTGMSKRLVIATKIAQGFVANKGFELKNTELMVMSSYSIADELLRQENL